MLHRMDSVEGATALALLEWQMALGADEAILDTALNRYDLTDPAPARPKTAPVPVPSIAANRPVEIAKALADGAATIDELAERMAGFDLCDWKRGARQFVFADGDRRARVMIVGEAPDRDDDIEGRPFAGRTGQLLDRMLDAIGLSRHHPVPEKAVYITAAIPWRPPAARAPDADELAMFLPFVRRHVQLAAPEFVVIMGNIPCQMLLDQARASRIRGQWTDVLGRPALPMVHPVDLLRNPAAKREAWADLLALKTRLTSPP